MGSFFQFSVASEQRGNTYCNGIVVEDEMCVSVLLTLQFEFDVSSF